MKKKLYTTEEIAKYVAISITGVLQIADRKSTAKDIIQRKEAIEKDLLLEGSMGKSIDEYERIIKMTKITNNG